MGFTIEHLIAITNAIARGALEYQVGTERVKYDSLREMLKVRALMLRQLSPVSSSLSQIAVIYPTTGRGL